MDPNEIRSKYWKLRERMEKYSGSTVDREMLLAQHEMLTEMCAQLAEMNVLLKSTLGIVNVEKLALDLGRVVQEQEESHGSASTR
jgi:hypothetical protein